MPRACGAGDVDEDARVLPSAFGVDGADLEGGRPGEAHHHARRVRPAPRLDADDLHRLLADGLLARREHDVPRGRRFGRARWGRGPTGQRDRRARGGCRAHRRRGDRGGHDPATDRVGREVAVVLERAHRVARGPVGDGGGERHVDAREAARRGRRRRLRPALLPARREVELAVGDGRVARQLAREQGAAAIGLAPRLGRGGREGRGAVELERLARVGLHLVESPQPGAEVRRHHGRLSPVRRAPRAVRRDRHGVRERHRSRRGRAASPRRRAGRRRGPGRR